MTFSNALTVFSIVLVLALAGARLSASRQPAPRALPRCTAYRILDQADSIGYEVWHKRGETCRVTLPTERVR